VEGSIYDSKSSVNLDHFEVNFDHWLSTIVVIGKKNWSGHGVQYLRWQIIDEYDEE